LGIDMQHYGTSLKGDRIWIEKSKNLNREQIVSTTRIGVDYAGADAQKLWRFYIKESKWVSKF